MRWRPLTWLFLSVLFFTAALYFWRLGDKWAAQRTAPPATQGATRATPPAMPIQLLSQAGTLNSPLAPEAPDQPAAPKTNRFALRLSNTTTPMRELQRSDTAILLENALLDTARPATLAIPDHLRAQGDPGTYVVQARGPIDAAFRSLLKAAGATTIAYIPNNAYLVRASGAVARQLQSDPQTQAVLPYEPYYKLKPSLLKLAAGQKPMPESSVLNLLLFADAREQTLADLESLGAQVLGEDPSPFGPVVRVLPPVDSLPFLAGLPGVQELELAGTRALANDLSRVRIGVSAETLAPTNYLGLTGTNVLVNVSDSGVDWLHPDLIGRVLALNTNALSDLNGHGTHVAGIIASSGISSTNPVNLGGAAGGSLSNASFRGKAPAAKIFAQQLGMLTGPFSSGATLRWPSDGEMQQEAARTNAFISNNSWNYVGGDSQTYDIHAASYDAAVRDALPTVSGSQPLLIVFPAGNSGAGADDGTAGLGDAVQSPGTAKNVITVGAIEQPRFITNEVWKCSVVGGTNSCVTNQPWLRITDSSDQIASFSSRGNVGIGIEGDFGRFKPDLVAPGTFVVSTTWSNHWDTVSYYNPTSHIFFAYHNLRVTTNDLWRNAIFVPANAVQLNISVGPNTNSPVPFPNLPIYVRQAAPPTNTPGGYDLLGTNQVSLPPDLALNPVGTYWYYGIGTTNTQPVFFDLFTDLVVTNDMGNYLQVLSNLNGTLGPYYRYESGTSMSAADASGTLALMQEFFESRLSLSNHSPALMKAMLINGARSVGDLYDFNVRGAVTAQGWGLINLPTSLPGTLTNITASSNSVFVLEQNATNALATGQSHTRYVSLSSTARNQPMRFTLVWTDPPGNPVASVKLVNDLHLVVTNLDNGSVYFGNDILSGSDFNRSWNTNTMPILDTVNNVENVYLSPALNLNGRLGTNYSVTVVGHRVNVNAVTANPDNVAQDYALVISSGNGQASSGFTLNTNTPVVGRTLPLVTVISNTFESSPGFAGGFLLNQRVGANTPLLGTNTILLPTEANGVLTLGMTNQWHFYAITNDTPFTNAAFLTFLPPNLAVPRMGVFEPTAEEATRPEADIDLYVAPPTIPSHFELTNLYPAVVDAAAKSQTRGGTETIVFSNAVPGIYYIGVKSEDQQAAEYAILGVFSEKPFGSTDENGNQSLIGFPVATIPDGSPTRPGEAFVMAISVQPIPLHRVVVTNTINHELIGDLQGSLTHDRRFAVLNNHTCVYIAGGVACETCTTYIYDDSDERNVGPGFTICNAHVQHTDGPGSLRNFAGNEGMGQWLLLMTDNAQNHIGTNVSMQIFLERQQDLADGIIAILEPRSCREDFVEVPNDAVSMTIDVGIITATPPIQLFLEVCPPDGGDCKSTFITNTLGGSVTIDQTDLPPLQPGATYVVRLCNLADTAIKVNIRASFELSLNTINPVISTRITAPVPILDDAVTHVYITNNVHQLISSLDVGLLIDDPRVSDLAITLISPNGTRVLLFENRGAWTTNGLGIGTFNLGVVTNMEPVYTNNFDAAPVGLYAPSAVFQGWSVLSNLVDVIGDYTCVCLSNHILALFDGAVSNTLPTTNAITFPALNPYTLSYKVTHLPWLEGMVTWWPLDVDGSDNFGGLNGLLLGDVVFSTGATNLFSDEFEGTGLSSVWQAAVPNAGTGGGATPVERYDGAPSFSIGTVGTNGVLRLPNTLNSERRKGWSSSTIFQASDFRYEVRFNTLDQGPAFGVGGFLEMWILDAQNTNRYDIVSPYGGSNGSSRSLLAGSSIDQSYNTLPFNFQTNTWYRLVLTAPPNQGVRAAVLSDTGTELAGLSFGHGASAFSSGFRIVLSQFLGTSAAAAPVDVAVDYVRLTTGQTGEVNQAFFGDGVATRMIVPRCPALDLGLGRGFSIEGWINPANLATNPNVGPVTVNVPSYYDWVGWPYNGANLWFDTGIDVAAGQQLLVTASGVVTFGGGVSAGPDGAPSYGSDINPYAIYTNTQLSSLIGKIGGTTAVDTGTPVPGGTAGKGPGFIGSSYSQVMPQTGRLFLTVNDMIWFNDNSGSFAATIKLVTPSFPAPLVEWNDPTNVFSQGVQLWLGGLPGTNVPGAILANIWDTNLQPHTITTAINVITNGGWQHIALTYNTNTANAILYTNGQPAATVHFLTNFVPRTSGDLYFGFHPPGLTNGTCYPGGLDEFSLYRRDLTPCEVNAIYNAGTRGKYGTNVLVCPVETEVTLLTASGSQTYTFTNGITWTNNGPHWETNFISFLTSSNPTPIIVRGLDPYDPADTNAGNNLNAVVDDFVLSALVTNFVNGLLHFTEDTNLAAIPIKFAPTPYLATNFPPVLIFSNSFDLAVPGRYPIGSTILGGTNDPALGPRNWTVTNGPVTVVSNLFIGVVSTQWLAMATGAVQCLLPTTPGHRYELSYNLRGPCAVGWWNGEVDPLNRRAEDVIGNNDGAFINSATISADGYVTAGRLDDTLWFPGIPWPPTNNPWYAQAPKVELGDPVNLRLTNSFTIEGWINPVPPHTNDIGVSTFQQIFFRGDSRDCMDPYYLAMQLDESWQLDLVFHVESENSPGCGVSLVTTNHPVLTNTWQHIAAVFEANVQWTNNAPWPTNEMRLYLDGQLLTNVFLSDPVFGAIETSFTGESPFGALDPAFSPGVTIGNVSRYDNSEPFCGYLDELTVYARALTGPEVAAIADAGARGKADLGAPAPLSLAKVSVTLDGNPLGVGYGDNSQWTTHTVEFTALQTNALLVLQSLLPGTLLEGVTLTELPPELYYLPEVPLSDMYGEDAFGVWTLEIWDNRVGLSTNNAQLIEWLLNFGLAPSNPPPVITLDHGIAYTNSIPAYGIQYFNVPVPQWATVATNILEFATQVRTANSRPVTVLFNQTNHPSPADLALIGPLVSSGTDVLTTNSTPPLVIGQTYFLAVTNPNPVGVTFGLGVWFDITPLTNCVMATNFVGPAGIPRYFQFDVPTNGQPAAFPAQSVAFWLTGANSNLTVVLNQHLPLPDLNHYDYISQQPCTNDEIVMVLTNTTPYPIQTNRWYVGVFNTTSTNVPFSVQACVSTDVLGIIPLTNGIPFVVPTNTSPFAAPAGPPQRLFFDFHVSNRVDGILFELFNLSGDADLVLQRDVPPTMAPYFDGSYAFDRAPEQIVVRTNEFMSDLRGHWYLGVYNNETNNVSYTVRAVLPNRDGLLVSAQPFVQNNILLQPPRGYLLSWNSVEGEHYIVQSTTNLAPPRIWSNIGYVTATTPLTTFEVVPAFIGTYYRVIQVFSAQPKLFIQLMPTNPPQVRISWSTAYPGYTLQSKLGLFGAWINETRPQTVIGTEYVVFDAVGLVPKYYRLIK